MAQIRDFQQRLKTASQNMNKKQVSQTIAQFKTIYKHIATFLQINMIQQNDHLSEIQITILNNLACLYERKGKYRSSLYHLQIAEKIQNQLFAQKYNHQNIPLIALQKLSTTYSNLSAIQSKLGNYKQAIQNCQFAIQCLVKNQQAKDHKSLIYLYYNYSFLLDVIARYNQSSQYAIEGLRIAQKINQKHMINNYQHLLDSLQQKLAKKEFRKSKEIKKHLQTQQGNLKNKKNIQQQPFDKKYSEQTNRTIKHSFINTKKINVLKEYLTAQQKYFARTSRHNSAYITLNNNRKVQNFSHYSNKQKPNLEEKAKEVSKERKKDVIRIQQGQKFSKISNKPNTLFNALDISSRIKRNKLNKTTREDTFKYRTKSKKLKLQQEIETLSQRNDTIEKIIQKIYKSSNKNS